MLRWEGEAYESDLCPSCTPAVEGENILGKACSCRWGGGGFGAGKFGG